MNTPDLNVENCDQILQIHPVPTFRVDAEQNIVFFNKAAENLTGYKSEELIGKKCHAISLEPCIYHCGMLESKEDTIHNHFCSVKCKNGNILKVRKSLHKFKQGKNILGALETFYEFSNDKYNKSESYPKKVLSDSHTQYNLTTGFEKINDVFFEFSTNLEQIVNHLLEDLPELFFNHEERNIQFEIIYKNRRYSKIASKKNLIKSSVTLPSKSEFTDSLVIYQSDKHTFTNADITILSNLAYKLSSRFENYEITKKLESSNRSMQVVLDTTADTVALIDKTGVVLGINKAGADRFNLSIAEMEGQNLYTLIPEPLSSERKRKIDKVFETGEAITFEDERNSTNYFNRVYPIWNNDRTEVIRASIYARDITEQKKNETALKESEFLYKITTEAANIGIWDWDIKSNKVYYNNIWKAQLGYNENELENSFATWEKLLHPDDSEYAHDRLKMYLQNPEGPFILDFRMKHKNGTFVWIHNHAESFINSEGEITRMFGTHIDVSEQKKYEEEIINNLRLNESLLKLYAYEPDNESDLIQYALDIFVELSESEIGYFHKFDKATNEIELVTWSTQTLKKCTAVYDKHYPLNAAGLWADAVRQKKPVIINDYAHATNKKGMPEGHFPLYRHLGIPVIEKNEVKAIIGIGNKKNPYNEEDLKHLEIYTKALWEILKIYEADLKLELSESKFRNLIDNAPLGLLVYDQDENIDTVNQMFTDFFGYNLTDFNTIKQFWRKVIPDKLSRKLFNLEWSKQIANDEASLSQTSKEIYLLTKAKEKKFVRIIHAHVQNLNILMFSDLTENKILLNKLNDTMENLVRSNKELEQFAYITSHDLQEPLRVVGSYVSLLEKRYQNKLDQDAHDFINFTVEGVARMQGLIIDLLKYSRVSTKNLEMDYVDADKIVADVIENLSLQIEDCQAQIEIDFLPEVFANETQLMQVFQNLIGNALKYRHPDRTPLIKISSSIKNKEVVFSVKDNGIGIDEKYFDRIFMIFQQLHAKTKFKGSGIGLAIVKKIVERHGGKIRVESQVNYGSTFYFSIPVTQKKELHS